MKEEEIRIDLRDLDIGLSHVSNIKELLLELLTKSIRIDTLTREAFFPVFSSLVFHDDNSITYKLNRSYLDHGVDSPDITPLKSYYSLRMLELIMKAFRNNQFEIEYSLDELRKLLGIPSDQYKRYSDFKKRVLETARIEILDITDWSFTYEEISKNRKVVKVKIKINRNS